MCWAITQIAWSIIDGKAQLQRSAFEGKSNWDWAIKTLRFGVEYLLACHIKHEAFVVQARGKAVHRTPNEFAMKCIAHKCMHMYDDHALYGGAATSSSAHQPASQRVSVLQIVEVEADHKVCLRAQLDATTPRTLLIVDRDHPGANAFAMALTARQRRAARCRGGGRPRR
jgi:hypothetical protein